MPLASEDLSAWPDGGGKGSKEGRIPLTRPPEDHYCVAEINRRAGNPQFYLCKVKKECRMAWRGGERDTYPRFADIIVGPSNASLLRRSPKGSESKYRGECRGRTKVGYADLTTQSLQQVATNAGRACGVPHVMYVPISVQTRRKHASRMRL